VTDLCGAAREIWAIADPACKCSELASLAARVSERAAPLSTGEEILDVSDADTAPVTVENLEPGRPDKPTLVHASKVAKRQTGRAGGRGPMLHAIAHIEFNAINLALDAAWRYPGMPDRFTTDWILVAADEARHFSMLCDELKAEGLAYGDFDAHDGLWSMARRTAGDLVARMALVPRVLEARGLDATPVIQRKLAAVGDDRGVRVLQVLLDEEIVHVATGDRWFRALCAREGVDAESKYRQLLEAFKAPMPKPPMNTQARREAGFSDSELEWLDVAGRPAQTHKESTGQN